MEDYNNKYDALVETIKIEDIATDKTNQDILRRLKQNDETFNNLWICNDRGFARGSSIIKERAYICYTEELGWLGYFIGKSIESMIPGYSKGSATTSRSERYVSCTVS